MASLAPLTALAPRFSNLQTLRIVQLSGKDESIEPLKAFITRHRSSSPTTAAAISNPLALNYWTNLQRLDLTLYQGMIDWHLIPRRSLVDLRFSIQSLCAPFEPSELLRPCARLETLHILDLEATSLSWLIHPSTPPAASTTPPPPLPRLHSLGLGGTIAGLIPSLAIAVDVFSERLLSLTLSLQQASVREQRPDRVIFTGNNRITLQKPLPNLIELVLRDKALFELNARVLADDQCPSLRVLDLGVDAERSGPGCTELGVGWTVKWIKVRNVFKRIQAWKRNNNNNNNNHTTKGGAGENENENEEEGPLEELRLRGFFSLTSAGLVDIIRPFKHLKRLYLGEARYIVDYSTRNSHTPNTLVSDICQGHTALTFFQATRWQVEGLHDPLPPGLELSLTGYNSFFEQIDEQEVVPL
ncbi:hypothetical protein BGZ70_002425 [Mortierella alpina]|uniref:F-box domain-containing protein n=1 Tax=Mortierella alpina TaxID=64518 RepID=A0A9P6M5J8_MORAP|nr:hypothetical protein BGZ70_002425 [Mortierella alpina]